LGQTHQVFFEAIRIANPIEIKWGEGSEAGAPDSREAIVLLLNTNPHRMTDL